MSQVPHAACGSGGKEGALDRQHLPRLPTPPYLREGLESPKEQQSQRCAESEHPGEGWAQALAQLDAAASLALSLTL